MTVGSGRLYAISGSASLTPTQALPLGGNGIPSVNTLVVADSLEANVLVVRDGPRGDPLVLVSLDLLYVGSHLRSAIETKLGDSLDPDALFLAASHTHQAPMTDPTKPALGTCSLDYVETVASTTSQLIADLLVAEPVPVTVRRGSGHLQSGINRRRRRLASLDADGLHVRPTIMAPNRHAPFDPAFHWMQFSSGEEVIADLWTTALHPTGFPEKLMVSADFPGVVREGMRERAGSGHAVLYLQGFSGDIRPSSGSVGPGIKRLLLGPIFAPFSVEEYERWTAELRVRVLGAHLDEHDCTPLASARVPMRAEDWLTGAPGPRAGAVHAVRIGSTVIIGVPGEVTNAYVRYLQPRRSGDSVWGVGCVDHVWGYVPTQAMLKEGGYEVSGFCRAFRAEHVNPDVEMQMQIALDQAHEAVSPRLPPTENDRSTNGVV